MMSHEEEKKMLKEAWKEALKETLMAEYAAIGRWFVRVVILAVLGLLLYVILWRMGWSPPDGPLKH